MSYDSVILGDQPIAWWKLADNAGSSSCIDSSSNGRTGTPHNVSLGQQSLIFSDPGESSGFFNGTNGYVSTAYNPSGLSAFSIEIWINALGNAQSYNRLISNDYTDGGDNKGFELFVNGTTTLQILAAIGNGSGYGIVGSSGVISAVGSHSVQVVWNGTTISLYLDGNLDPFTATISGALVAGSNNVAIGAEPAFGPGSFFRGMIGQVALYNYALSAIQITNHYQAATAIGRAMAPIRLPAIRMPINILRNPALTRQLVP